jgi:hypothetical protein
MSLFDIGFVVFPGACRNIGTRLIAVPRMIRHPGSTRINTWIVRAGVLAAFASLAWITAAAPAEAQSATVPRYDADGRLLAPVGFESWVFVGSNLGLAYRQGAPVAAPVGSPAAAESTPARQGAPASQGPGAPQFHNIFINPEAYAHFLATREFPVPTILVIEKFAAADKEPRGIVANGVFNGQWQGLEVAVKNPARPDGQTTPWAYYDFTDRTDPTKPVASASARPDAVCENCHREHASLDHVWVQFYPILRNLIK